MERNRFRFYAALGLFTAWVIGLAVMAFTSSEKPPPAAPAPALLDG